MDVRITRTGCVFRDSLIEGDIDLRGGGVGKGREGKSVDGSVGGHF